MHNDLLDRTSLSDGSENGGKIYRRNFHAQFPEGRRDNVTRAFNVMARDYGTAFTRQFEPERGELAGNVYDWKCRLLELSKPYSDQVLVNAVDNVCRLSPEFPPMLRLIEGEMKRLHVESIVTVRNAETLARAREPRNPTGRERMAGLMRDFADKLRERQENPPTDEERLDRVLAYEIAMYEVAPDKTLPRMREFCQTLADGDPDGKTAPEFACESALRQGGEVLSMCRQISDYEAAR